MLQKFEPRTLEQIQGWINTMRPHWIRCQGNIHNDPKFWNECIHSRDDVWGAVVDFYCTAREHPDTDHRHPHLNSDLGTIAQRMDAGERITIPYNKTGYNKPVFRATMAIKDIYCRLTDQPMQDHLPEARVKRAKPTRDEVLAQYAKLGQMIDELFE